MPTFFLRRNCTSRAYPNHFTVILTMEDGYELLTMMDRHEMDGAAYNMLINLSAELHSALSQVNGPSKTRERLMRVRAG